ncbi:unnamed protein product [Calypogeia fissa]
MDYGPITNGIGVRLVPMCDLCVACGSAAVCCVLTVSPTVAEWTAPSQYVFYNRDAVMPSWSPTADFLSPQVTSTVSFFVVVICRTEFLVLYHTNVQKWHGGAADGDWGGRGP